MITLRRFARLMRGQHGSYLVLVGAWCLLRVGTLVVGLLLQQVFDDISGADEGGLNAWSLIAAVVGVEAARQILQFTVVISRLEPGIVFRTRAVLRDELLQARLRAPADDSGDGQLLTTMGTDVEEVSTFAAWSPANIARWLFAVAAFAILMSVDATLASSVLLLLLLLASVVRLLHARYRRRRAAAVAATARVRVTLRDAVAGAAVIQAARAERHVGDHLHRLGDARRQAAVTEETYASLQQNVIANAAPLGVGLVLVAADQGLRDGSLTVGDIALFGYYLQMLTEALASLGLLVVRFQRLGVSLERMHRLGPEVLTGHHVRRDGETVHDRPRSSPVPPSPVPPSPVPSPAAGPRLRELTVRSLSYRPAHEGQGVYDVSFTVPAGTLTVVTGRVGAGKTTLVRAVLGLLAPVEGEVLWNGDVLPPGSLIPPRCAYVPQVPKLFAGTLRDNILLGAEPGEEHLERAVRRARLALDLEAMPHGLETAVGSGGLRLSGGQLQRVAIARALVRRPQIIVLDDGSSAIDGRTEGELLDELRREGTTLVAVSHRRGLLRAADRIILLEQGCVTGSGTLPELLAAGAGMRSLWAVYAERDER